MPHYIDGLAEAARTKIEFDKFKLQPEDLSVEEIDLLLSIPEVDSGCRVRRAKNKSGSAFDQMWELGIVCGFMRGADKSIRVLVVYTERPEADGSYDFGFVAIDQIRKASAAQKKGALK